MREADADKCVGRKPAPRDHAVDEERWPFDAALLLDPEIEGVRLRDLRDVTRREAFELRVCGSGRCERQYCNREPLRHGSPSPVAALTMPVRGTEFQQPE